MGEIDTFNMDDLAENNPYMMERMSKIREYYMRQTKAKLANKILGIVPTSSTPPLGTEVSERQVTNENPFANPNESSPPVYRQSGTVVQ